MDERRQEIIDLVNQKGEISFQMLKERFPDVSEVTLRKDLRKLDEKQLLIRVYGGAKSISTAFDHMDKSYVRFAKNVDEKNLIAKKAIKLLKPYDALYLAAGSTCTAIAKNLPNIPLKVFTDGLESAINLAKLKNIEVTVLGGEIEPDTMRIVGPKVLAEIEQLRLDYAFYGTVGYSPEYGFGCPTTHIYMLVQALLRRANKCAVVMDSSKVGCVQTVRNIAERDVDILISDNGLSPELVAHLESQGVKVL